MRLGFHRWPGADVGAVAVSGAAAEGGQWWGTEAVSVHYGSRLALDQVSMRAEAGHLTAVVGGDGAGRTTLLRCLAGAVAPSSGQVSRPAPSRIGYACGGSTYPDLTVTENLDFRAAAYRVPAALASQRVQAYLERAGLAAARDRLAGQLSGGMRQKLSVIAALVHAPDLLVLDEPTTGVDPVSRADLWWLIARAAADGAAVVLATSYLDEAERAWQVLVLDAGTELASGTPSEIVAAMPGSIRVSEHQPAAEEGRRCWRRAGQWRTWDPAGGAGAVPADLQDAVTVAALRRELSAGRGSPEAPEGPTDETADGAQAEREPR
ncbi:MAG TPA: ABC transporter ATP-binding protein [Streptosporangiaceae bacterium]|nr:ABC transporter ATP-binding protein [Streptosporangiaceae bacterium]